MTGPDNPEATPAEDAPEQPMVLTVELTGDRLAAENVILEVRKVARQFGLDIADLAMVRQPSIAAKTAIAGLDSVPDPDQREPDAA